MTGQEIIDELNHACFQGFHEWRYGRDGGVTAFRDGVTVNVTAHAAFREAQRLRRSREAPSLDAIMPLLEVIADYGDGWGADPETPVGLYVDGDSLLDLREIPTTHGAVHKVIAAWNAMPRRSDGLAWRSEPPDEPGWWLACRMVGGKPRQVELTKVEEVCVVTTNGLPLNDPKRLWWFGPLPDGAAAGDAEKEVAK